MKYLLEYNGRGAYVEMQPGDSSDYYGAVQRAFIAQCGGADDKWAYCAMIDMRRPETACGVPFTWGLANSDGAYFELLALPGITAEQISMAKHRLRNDRDVVSMNVRRVTKWFPFAQPAREVVA